MLHDTNEIITVDSDSSDEFEVSPPSKKVRLDSTENSSTSAQEALKKLNSLKEISTFPEKNREVKITSKNSQVVNSLTIIIESDEIAFPKVENNEVNCTASSGNVVVIDPIDDEPTIDIDPKENVNNDCTVIVDDPSEECEDASPMIEEVSPSGDQTENNVKACDTPSTSTASEAHKLLEQFLNTCSNSIKGSKYESKLLTKFPKMREHFDKCTDLHNETSFHQMLQNHTNTCAISAPDAVISFQRIYSFLLDNLNGGSIEVPSENVRKIKKLEKTCKLLVKKLKELEEAEVDFDDESDSTYIQIDRYSQRLNKVYNKYCQLLNKDPYSGRLLYEKIKFVNSKYDEINRAITKSCKNNKFPSYYDIEKCIKNCVSKYNLPLSDADIKEESKHCFSKLGNLLQLRRKKELYEIHGGFITLSEDPANNDPELKIKLQESLNEGHQRMAEVVEKYVKFQENNITVDVSEDSDDSHYKSSDADES